MKALLISACLLGMNCKYSGGNNKLDEEALKALRCCYRLIPVCPETAGGLATPRAPSERKAGKVVSVSGLDVTDAFDRGAVITLKLSQRFGCKAALLKERSPSCGNGQIYDGSFSGHVIPGFGLAAERLKESSVVLYGESQIEELLKNV